MISVSKIKLIGSGMKHIYFSWSRLFCALLITISAVPVTAQEGVFERPKFIEESTKTFSFYPGSELSMARTARIMVSFMVDKNGDTYAPIIEQANNDRFNGAALKWVEMMKFEPATVDGEPVDSVFRYRTSFNFGYGARSPQVRTKLFNKHNANFNKELAKADPKKSTLEKYIKKMEGAKHGTHLAYEYISLARYRFAEKFGDRNSQIIALKEMMLSNDRGMAALDGKLADMELLKLLIEAGNYGEATQVYNDILNRHTGQIAESTKTIFGKTMREISDILESDKAFAREIKIADNGYMFLPMSKGGLVFDQVQGDLAKMVLRCSRKYAEIPIKSGDQYQIPESWGYCQMQILGEPGSSALLTQF